MEKGTRDAMCTTVLQLGRGATGGGGDIAFILPIMERWISRLVSPLGLFVCDLNGITRHTHDGPREAATSGGSGRCGPFGATNTQYCIDFAQ